MWVDVAPWDPTNGNALIIGATKDSATNSLDYVAGIALNSPVSMVPPNAKKWRLGWRMSWPETPGGSNALSNTPVHISAIEYVVTPPPIGSYQLGSTPGVPFYYELEVDTSGNYVLFIDGAQVTSGNKPSLVQGIMIYFEAYRSGSVTRYRMPGIAISDMYWQTIESDADTALGPGTVVRQAVPSTDDQVQFARPASYSSNASVVSGDVTISSGGGYTNILPNPSDKILTANAAGAQDLYQLDLSLVTSQLATVESVRIRTIAGNPGSIPSTFAPIAKVGTHQVEGDGVLLPAQAGYRYSGITLNADPSDNARWDMAKLARLKVGSKLIS